MVPQLDKITGFERTGGEEGNAAHHIGEGPLNSQRQGQGDDAQNGNEAGYVHTQLPHHQKQQDEIQQRLHHRPEHGIGRPLQSRALQDAIKQPKEQTNGHQPHQQQDERRDDLL